MALGGDLLGRAHVDQLQVGVLGDGRVQVIDGDAAEPFGHGRQIPGEQGRQRGVDLGRVERLGHGQLAGGDGIAALDPAAEAAALERLDIIPAHRIEQGQGNGAAPAAAAVDDDGRVGRGQHVGAARQLADGHMHRALDPAVLFQLLHLAHVEEKRRFAGQHLVERLQAQRVIGFHAGQEIAEQRVELLVGHGHDFGRGRRFGGRLLGGRGLFDRGGFFHRRGRFFNDRRGRLLRRAAASRQHQPEYQHKR